MRMDCGCVDQGGLVKLCYAHAQMIFYPYPPAICTCSGRIDACGVHITTCDSCKQKRPRKNHIAAILKEMNTKIGPVFRRLAKDDDRKIWRPGEEGGPTG